MDIEFKKFLESPAVLAGKFEAVINVLKDGRRMLVGFKRKNKKASRKGHESILLREPVIIDELLKTLTPEQRAFYGVKIEPVRADDSGAG